MTSCIDQYGLFDAGPLASAGLICAGPGRKGNPPYHGIAPPEYPNLALISLADDSQPRLALDQGIDLLIKEPAPR